jgi:hypothetical protein
MLNQLIFYSISIILGLASHAPVHAQQAGQIHSFLLNVPTAAHHFGTRHDDPNKRFNEFFLDDGALGFSYMHERGFGASINQSINSYGVHRSFYVTADFITDLYHSGKHFINGGAMLGFATGYKELTRSGTIPFVGVIGEYGYGRYSILLSQTPSYEKAPPVAIVTLRYRIL